jgi:hypothetical protein
MLLRRWHSSCKCQSASRKSCGVFCHRIISVRHLVGLQRGPPPYICCSFASLSSFRLYRLATSRETATCRQRATVRPIEDKAARGTKAAHGRDRCAWGGCEEFVIERRQDVLQRRRLIERRALEYGNCNRCGAAPVAFHNSQLLTPRGL